MQLECLLQDLRMRSCDTGVKPHDFFAGGTRMSSAGKCTFSEAMNGNNALNIDLVNDLRAHVNLRSSDLPALQVAEFVITIVPREATAKRKCLSRKCWIGLLL